MLPGKSVNHGITVLSTLVSSPPILLDDALDALTMFDMRLGVDDSEAAFVRCEFDARK